MASFPNSPGALLQVRGAQKSFGSRILFQDAQVSFLEGEHVGVIGPNGAGKSTLFKAMIGEVALDDGEIIRSANLRLGYLSQYDDFKLEETGDEYVARKSGAESWELRTIGASLGLEDKHFEVAIGSLSGGYRMRLKLTAVLGEQPNLLLLDEPTNYLDLESVLTLENFLQGFNGAFALISHDREFLKRVTDQTIEVEAGEITKYPGNLEDYFEQKALLTEQLAARAASLDAKRAEIQSFVDRFRAKASKAKQAQSRLKSLDRLETVEVKPVPKTARIKIPAPERLPKLPIQIKQMKLGYPGRTILEKVDFNLGSNAHIGILGMNGAGKSTLLKALAGVLEPTGGELIVYGGKDSIGYYAQHVTESLDPAKTVYQEMEYGTGLDISPQMILDVAGSLLFSGKDIEKRVRDLSGGEKSRVALGKILLKRYPILILDEPTNHLDFQTVSALAEALNDFPGVVIAVSHDRSFIARIANQLIEVDNGRALLYPGTYSEYLWSLQNRMFKRGGAAEAAKSPASKISVEAPKAEKKESGLSYEAKKEKDRLQKKMRNDLAKVESRLKTLHDRQVELNEKVASRADPKAIQELGEVSSEMARLEEEWLTLHEKLEG
jgi:ATP-binding cassette, subfamily F, member 3